MKIKALILLISLIFNLLFMPKAMAQSVPLKAFNGETLDVSVVTPERAQEIFEYLLKQRNIPYGYVADGCAIRAYQMADILRTKSLVLAKIIVEVANPERSIVYRKEGLPWQAKWKFHIAPIIHVIGKQGLPEIYVIDPALFDRPVPRQEWLDEVTQYSDFDPQTDLNIYYISRNNLGPDDKETIFTEVSRQLDVRMPEFLAQISHDFRRYGAFQELCILKDVKTNGAPYTRGGLPVEDIDGELKKFPFCEFGG